MPDTLKPATRYVTEATRAEFRELRESVAHALSYDLKDDQLSLFDKQARLQSAADDVALLEHHYPIWAEKHDLGGEPLSPSVVWDLEHDSRKEARDLFSEKEEIKKTIEARRSEDPDRKTKELYYRLKAKGEKGKPGTVFDSTGYTCDAVLDGSKILATGSKVDEEVSELSLRGGSLMPQTAVTPVNTLSTGPLQREFSCV